MGGPGTLKAPELFLNDRGKRLSRQGLHLIIKTYVRQAGLPDDVSAHTLRHSFATHLLEGALICVRSRRCSATPISTTQIYTHVTSAHLQEDLPRRSPSCSGKAIVMVALGRAAAAKRRVVFIVLDGVGVGALPDAAEYGDTGSDTLGNLSRIIKLNLPNFQRLGLGNIIALQGVLPTQTPLCLPGRLAPASHGKDTTVGHWEHMGLITSRPFPTYADGFPPEIIKAFGAAIGRQVLGNKPASGTAIIAESGEEHLATGAPIVYTSADSVCQIAAHESVIPVPELYSICETARRVFCGEHAVGRIIARPFTGEWPDFARTANRHDISLPPPEETALDLLKNAGFDVIGVGKINDIFAGRGLTEFLRTGPNEIGMRVLVIDLLRGRSPKGRFDRGLLVTNLVEFDMVWGHRNDVEGFARGLAAVDAVLPSLFASLRSDDLLIISADHGVDPSTPSTDHSREYVPLLLYPRPANAPRAVYEGSFADTGATAFKYLTGGPSTLAGTDINDLRPSRGWRRYTPIVRVTGADPDWLPTRAGSDEADEAARWLRKHLGPAPDGAVILGSGLDPSLSSPTISEVAYDRIPHWPTGTVGGHPCRLSLVKWGALRIALLRGRVHEYEGYDLGEVQLAVNTMAAWGVRRMIITTASGAVDERYVPGDVVVIHEILDCQYPNIDGEPVRLRGTDASLLAALGHTWSVHASVTGPQYETPAELAVLRSLGAHTVSMSPAGEVRAVHDQRMHLATLTVVANAGDTTHDEVLAAVEKAGRGLTRAIEAVFAIWTAPTTSEMGSR